MKFKEGDRVEFINEETLVQGVVSEIFGVNNNYYVVAIDHATYTDECVRNLSLDSKVRGWLWETPNQELFARAWLDGYEVEQEPRRGFVSGH
ncbi:DUF1642 domain-containing protein [Listeria monocytogenes]